MPFIPDSMKPFFLALSTFCVLSAGVQAQAPQLGCISPNTRLLADEVKQHFISQGYAVVRDAMVGMSSHQPFRAVVQLEANQNYRIVFVADRNAKFMDVEVIDNTEKEVAHEKRRLKRDQSPVIEFPFRQSSSAAYLFSLYQQMRPNDACGSFTILRDTVKARKMQVKPY